MLTLTETAQDVITRIVEGTEAEERGGLRISAQPAGEEEQAQLNLALASEPSLGDQVLESATARVFLDEEAKLALDDKVLDAQPQPDGRVAFSLAQQ